MTPASMVVSSIFTVSDAFPGTTLEMTGAPGIEYGTKSSEDSEASDIPAALMAFIRMVYVDQFVNPVRIIVVRSDVEVAVVAVVETPPVI